MRIGHGQICGNCEVGHWNLRRCGGCGHIRYCSKECQKAHWGAHRTACKVNAELMQKAAEQGLDYNDQAKAIEKWIDRFMGLLIGAAVHVLDL
ncbi:hypothetical protein DFH08DRAFT_889295 [Mycena albidolilacea]|uniref:MYND-type domain-containing protein n=1 Tax=Mycena albidolilacea TaxID=1033008 RepID=A0AAD7EHL6_9AGAR|nr:hypothetical protein DFH08DRAFT_889295 [Mycena albidolilacea]